MLERLLEYGRNHGLVAEPGFGPKDVKWAIDFTTKGHFLEVHLLGDPEDKRNRGQLFVKCPDFSQPELIGGTEERCHFLAESAQVVVLLFKGDEDEKTRIRIRGKHSFFLKVLKEAASVLPELKGVASSLGIPDTLRSICAKLKEKKAKVTDRVTLRIGETYPLESDVWHDWWRRFRRGIGGESKAATAFSPRMRCFATGELESPASTHLKILGLSNVGGLGTGDALVCFDKDAFNSYGLKQSANSAVSEVAMAEYRAALNHLIREHGQRLAGSKVVHWYKEKIRTEEDLLPLLLEAPEQEERSAQIVAKDLLESIRAGKRSDLARNRFYALTLSGASGRVMVRDWMEGAFEQLADNISLWFEDLSIVCREGDRLASGPKFMAVLCSTLRKTEKPEALAPPFVAKMWRVAIARETIPPQALAQALVRTKTEFVQADPPNHARMGLLKAFILRTTKGGGVMGPYLNEDHPHPAYHCGRLMSVLADLQYDALGDVGAGVVQRFYAGASSTPALVLGRLVRNAQFHVVKSKYPGMFQGRIASIWSRIQDNVPATLTLEEQTLFALGYYQQMAADRAARSQRNIDKRVPE